MSKPIFVMWIQPLNSEELNNLKRLLDKKIGQDYHIILLGGGETRIQVFTDREIMPIELQLELDKLLA